MGYIHILINISLKLHKDREKWEHYIRILSSTGCCSIIITFCIKWWYLAAWFWQLDCRLCSMLVWCCGILIRGMWPHHRKLQMSAWYWWFKMWQMWGATLWFLIIWMSKWVPTGCGHFVSIACDTGQGLGRNIPCIISCMFKCSTCVYIYIYIYIYGTGEI
jgi:hypothetical protein